METRCDRRAPLPPRSPTLRQRMAEAPDGVIFSVDDVERGASDADLGAVVAAWIGVSVEDLWQGE